MYSPFNKEAATSSAELFLAQPASTTVGTVGECGLEKKLKAVLTFKQSRKFLS